MAIDLNKFRDELISRRVAVWRSSDGAWQPIPVAITPTIVSSAEWSSLEKDARVVFGVFPKVMAWLQKPCQKDLFEKLFAGLSGFEARFLAINPELAWGHVTARLDLFWHGEEIKIIEVNCTIPAMQSYSDNVIAAWNIAGGSSQPAESNAGQLLQSLIAMYRMDGGFLAFPRILILHRDGDSQLGELLWLRDKWSSLGYETTLATPDQVTRMGDVWLKDDVPYDVVYRHVFAWRLKDYPISQFLGDHRRHHIYNPVSAHYETKAFLALTSQIVDDSNLTRKIAISEEDVKVIKKRVPWSRIVGGGISGVSIESIESRLPNVVIKRSVGYGGHHVIMGDQWYDSAIQERLKEMTGMANVVSFATFAEWVQTKDESLWVVQERMSGAKRTTEVLTSSGIELWDAWYDASIFINTRTPPICMGGVSRIAKNPIVNIGTGGGLAPFVIKNSCQTKHHP